MVVFGHENRCMQVNAIRQNVAVAAAALQVSSRGHDHLHIIATGAAATAAYFIGPTLDPYAAVRPSFGRAIIHCVIYHEHIRTQVRASVAVG